MSDPQGPSGAARPTPQPAVATAAAIHARRARAAVKAAMRSGTRTPLDVLTTAEAHPDAPEGRLRLPEFLVSVPGIGPARMTQVLTDLGIGPRKHLGGLGRRQRPRLRTWLRDWDITHDGHGHRLVVLAGPTAVGKGTVAAYIRHHHPEVLISVSTTTRSPRPGEIPGVHYHFVTDPEFDGLIAGNEFLEWAVVHNTHRYGTPRAPVEAAIVAGRSVLLEIDLQGARMVRQVWPEATFVFLQPPSWEELTRRLVGRASEPPEEQERRLRTARAELAAVDEFDVQIVNDDVRTAAEAVVDLLRSSGPFAVRSRRSRTRKEPPSHG